MDVNEIFKRLQNEMNPKYENSTPGFFTYDVLKSGAVEFVKLYNLIDNISKKIDPRNLVGDELERETSLRRGIKRKQATKAVGKITVKGNGTIKIGDLFSTPDNINFQSKETKTIVGSGEINIECVETGGIGNVGVGLITQMPVTIPGITSIINDNFPTVGGYEKESDTSLLDRYIYDIQNPITSNNIYHFSKWARDVPGVGKSKIFPTWNGNNSVKVVILDDNMIPAPDNIVKNTQDYIDPKDDNKWGKGYGQSALGSYCTVIAATAKNININVKVRKSNNFSKENIETSVKDAIINYFKEIAFSEIFNFVSYAKVSSLIISAAGVLDISNLKINGGINNINLNDEEVAVLGTTTIEVI